MYRNNSKNSFIISNKKDEKHDKALHPGTEQPNSQRQQVTLNQRP